MRRLILALTLVLAVASSAVAQRVDGGVRVNGALQGTPINNPIFTGQWTVNLVLCATGTVLQGGSPTTCTATPTLGVATTVPGTLALAKGVGGGALWTLASAATSNWTLTSAATVPSQGDLFTFSNATGQMASVPAAATGQVLISQGVNAVPIYSASPSVSALITPIVKPSVDTSTAVSIANAAGTGKFVFNTADGRMAIGTASAPGNTLDVLESSNSGVAIKLSNATSGTASSASLQAQAGSGSINIFAHSQGFTTSGRDVQSHGLVDSSYLDLSSAGANPIDFWSNNVKIGSLSSAGKLNTTGGYQVNGVDFAVGTPCSNTAASTDITGTNTKTYFSISCKIPANTLSTAGDFVSLAMRGLYSGNATDSMTMTLEACQVQGCASGTKVTIHTAAAITLTAVSNQAWWLDTKIVSFTTGATGGHDAQGHLFYELTGTTATPDALPNTTTIAWDDTVDEYLTMSVTFSTNSGNDHASIRSITGLIQ